MKKILSILLAATVTSVLAISAVNAATGTTSSGTTKTTSTSTTKTDCAPGDVICEFAVDTAVVTKTGATTSTNNNTTTPTNTQTTTTPVNNTTSNQVAITTETVVGTGYVDLIVKATNPSLNVKRANIVVNFPNVVSTSTGEITKGMMFDMVNPTETKVDTASGTVTFSATSANGNPLNGEIVKIRFTIKPSTVSNSYPFSVDLAKSSFTDNLNNTVTLNGDSAKMVVLSSAAITPTVVDSKTGFKENVVILAIIALLSIGFLTTRRERVL